MPLEGQVSAIIEISWTHFSGNKADYGGGAIEASFQSELRLNDCRLEDNFAKHDGGAINLYENTTSEIHETIFAGNKASYGGAVYSQLNITLCIEESTFTSNYAQRMGRCHRRSSLCDHRN